MRTKRLKKLLMGLGLTRNQANHLVADQQKNGSPTISNAVYYKVVKDSIGAPLWSDLRPFIWSIVLK